MKQNIAKVLTFSLLATSAVFISCVDKICLMQNN